MLRRDSRGPVGYPLWARPDIAARREVGNRRLCGYRPRPVIKSRSAPPWVRSAVMVVAGVRAPASDPPAAPPCAVPSRASSPGVSFVAAESSAAPSSVLTWLALGCGAAIRRLAGAGGRLVVTLYHIRPGHCALAVADASPAAEQRPYLVIEAARVRL